MPLDGTYVSPREEDWGLNRAKGWELKFCWRPKTCFLTGKQLWGKKAYRGIRWVHGPGDPIEEVYWVDKKEYFFWQFKRSG